MPASERVCACADIVEDETAHLGVAAVCINRADADAIDQDVGLTR
jgi:hypothetical protein